MSGQATLSFGGDTILLQPAELDRLLRSLRQIQSPAAASMAEEISARTLTGHIELSPTEAELEALFSALVRLRSVAQDLSAFPRLLALVQEQQARTRRSGRPSPTTWPRALVVAEEPKRDINAACVAQGARSRYGASVAGSSRPKPGFSARYGRPGRPGHFGRPALRRGRPSAGRSGVRGPALMRSRLLSLVLPTILPLLVTSWTRGSGGAGTRASRSSSQCSCGDALSRRNRSLSMRPCAWKPCASAACASAIAREMTESWTTLSSGSW
jgi:hypothetical protein